MMRCPICNTPAIAVRKQGFFYAFYVHRETRSLATGRSIVTGCRILHETQVEQWTERVWADALREAAAGGEAPSPAAAAEGAP